MYACISSEILVLTLLLRLRKMLNLLPQIPSRLHSTQVFNNSNDRNSAGVIKVNWRQRR